MKQTAVEWLENGLMIILKQHIKNRNNNRFKLPKLNQNETND